MNEGKRAALRAAGLELDRPSSAAMGAVDDGQCGWVPTLADVATVTGYGLGLWWGFGGPTWAGLASVVLDEVDGRLARATDRCSSRGSALDWATDVTLTPLALHRLGQALGHEGAALAVAPVVLYAQAHARGKGWAPPIASARAVVTVAAVLVELAARPNAPMAHGSRGPRL